ncbi:MAG: RNA polymerase sigma factor [Flavobacteriales bacterium]|jgi:RNA polymerase sigma-70 factor (ECF subfamily)
MRNLKDLNDDVLLLRYRKSGDSACISQLYTRYSHLVLGVCLKYLGNREDAEDVTIEVFTGALEKWKTDEINSVPAWLHVVARNKCFNVLERQKRFLDILREKQSELHEPVDEQAQTSEEWLCYLRTALSELPEMQRFCIESFYFRQMSYKHISEAASLTFDEVRSHVQNGRRRLRQLMKKTA